MKRIVVLIVTLTLFGTTAFAWSVREHATVAQIAENHLSPKARKLISKYLDGRPMAYYASHADYYRKDMLVDVGFVREDGSRLVVFPHTFHVDSELRAYRDVVKNDGKIFGNMLYHIDRLASNLKENHRAMNDSVRLTHLYLIIHGIGDMHCPMHMRFAEHNDEKYKSLGTYQVLFGKNKKWRKIGYHAMWDAHMVGPIHPWGYEDMARLFDIYNKREVARICEGDIFAWGGEVAKVAYPMREYGPNAKIDEIEYRRRYQQTAENLLAQAGYRLAKVLNEILK